MEYFLPVTNNALFLFNSQDQNRKKAGFIEYFDKENPIGLLKAHFCIIQSGGIKDLDIISVWGQPVDEEVGSRVARTFESIEKAILEKNILPKSAVITGIYFFNNSEMGIVQQVIRYYAYPNKPRNYSLTVSGRHLLFNMRAAGTGKKKPHNKNHQNKHRQERTIDFDQTNAASADVDDQQLDQQFNGNGDNECIVVEHGSKPVEGMSFTTDTGISEPISEELYKKAVEEEAKAIEELLLNSPVLQQEVEVAVTEVPAVTIDPNENKASA